MRLRAFHPTGLAALLTSALAGAGCDTRGEPARPAAPPAVAPVASFPVGPSPLRRLSNGEYLHVLRDTFPALDPPLPTLPPDVPVAGFDNAAEGQEPSDVLVARYEAVANLYAQAATADTAAVTALVGCADWSTAPLAAACAAGFVDRVGGRLFRRPLSGDEHARLLAQFEQWESAVDFEGAAQLTLAAMLQSPQFLYRAEPVPVDAPIGAFVNVDAYALASRLSFLLWESAPDDLLLQAASRDELRTDEQLLGQATRMLGDPRARRILWDFPRQWLGLDRILLDEHSTRTAEVDPAWTAATQASASQETQLFVENVLAQGGTLRDLLTSRHAWVDGEMARVYGLAPPPDPTAWTETWLADTERSGLLTRVSFLAGYSHRGATSPPVRGNAIELRLLCQLPVSPPPGVDLSQPVAASTDAPQTNRMLFEARTKPAACQACHAALNGFGFGFEGYDAAGHYRTTDNGLPVDASGEIHGTDVDGPFQGAVALSEALARSQVVHACATQEMVRFALGRAPIDVESPTVSALTKTFMDQRGDLRALLLGLVTSSTFRMRAVSED